jgi:predicted DNA-binding transcriptional regulator AlpA
MERALVTAERIAKVSGLSLDWVRKHARLGTFPGAFKLGGVWRFDEARFLRWLEQREQKPCQSTNGEKPGGYDSNGGAGKLDARLKRLYGEWH